MKDRFLKVTEGHETTLELVAGSPPAVHVWEKDAVLAINAALAAQRPLLVRGEPGVGKSQLARAAATELKRAFVGTTVDVRTEPSDLLWRFDAVARLAEAQLLRTASSDAADPESKDDRQRLAEHHFVRPAVLWWAFSWSTALGTEGAQAPPVPEGCDPKNGVVALIDEIDKGDPSVPNGLLQALGEARFVPPGWGDGDRVAVSLGDGMPPLVVITTNEERTLPDAFLRRCIVLPLGLPTDEDELIRVLAARGRAHFTPRKVHDEVLHEAAEQLSKDRQIVIDQGLNPPGQAEYLDLLRALSEQEKTKKGQLDLLREISRFTFRKHLHNRD